LSSDLSAAAKSNDFMELVPSEVSAGGWHTVCSNHCNKNKIGFPGWPEPNLDWDSGFGGSVRKRGLAPAPFFISSVVSN